VPVIVGLLMLVLPASAAAGGWATVGLSSLPDGTPAGGTWIVDIEVRQHGMTPLPGVEPAVLVRGPDGGVQRFAAKPAESPGDYRAEVTFPTSGTFSYEVDDGFGRRHAFAPVEIGAGSAAAASGGDDTPWLAPLGAAIAGIAAAGLAALALRRRRPALAART
jgi:hypothetical protein